MQGLCHTDIIDLSVTDRGIEILKNITIHLHCSSFSALVGPNGAGKTTLLKSLMGEIKHSGTITFNQNHRQPKVGYVPQKIYYANDNPATVYDLFLLTYSKKPIFLPASKTFKFFVEEALTKSLVLPLINRPLRALSGGELRRVFLALALAGKPELLLLDEAATGLDQNGLELFYQLIADIRKEYDLSILMVSHNFKLVEEYADYAYLLDNGSLVDDGMPEELFHRGPFLKLFS